jgi:hypothetical protein
MPGHSYSASARNAERNVIRLARLKRDAIFDRIIAFLLKSSTGTHACAV